MDASDAIRMDAENQDQDDQDVLATYPEFQTGPRDEARYAMVYYVLNLLPSLRPGWGDFLRNTAVFLLIFWLAGIFDGNWYQILAFGAVLLIQDLSLLAAMRVLSYYNARLIFLPFMSLTIPQETHQIAAWRRCLVYLAGPATGILVGVGLSWWLNPLANRASMPFLYEFVVLLLVYNAFLLLPFVPFKGGLVANELVFIRWPYLEFVFSLLGMGLFSWYLFRHGHYILLALIVFALPRAWATFRRGQTAHRLRRDLNLGPNAEAQHLDLHHLELEETASRANEAMPTPPERASAREAIPPYPVFEQIMDHAPVTQGDLGDQAVEVQELWQRINHQPTGVLATFMLFVLYLGVGATLVLGFLPPGMAARNRTAQANAAQATLARGESELRQAKLEDARATFEQALAVAPEVPKLQARAHLALALVDIHEGKLEDAESRLTRAVADLARTSKNLREAHDDAALAFMRAELKLAQGDWAGAETVLDQAAATIANSAAPDPVAADTIGYGYLRLALALGMTADASPQRTLDLMEKALAIDPTVATDPAKSKPRYVVAAADFKVKTLKRLGRLAEAAELEGKMASWVKDVVAPYFVPRPDMVTLPPMKGRSGFGKSSQVGPAEK